ncbi:putative carboxyl transferase/pyruvate carboxylase [Rhizocola hellebori]|uniref:Putative carboxyl transferase/pyruvate carboxylase n=1 Tax=Rhizocola hellebori TaxID=1392758 RepID=A0A8J3QDG9_9ACTN|nr:carboxyl transferase domain-containing protein [Rhizocola hellebori]GIH07341.1 putative carboxyl transferase/pyruvate carboxylase [Rhizocola hellebori]
MASAEATDGSALQEISRRRALTLDAARPQPVAARHAAGGRTARENIADLVDEDSFVEYGAFATAAQEQHRSVEELIERTPADGLVGGTARVNGLPCAVLSYDYLVMAGTQGMRGHHKTDRLLGLAERLGLPVVFFAEGGGGRPGDSDYPVVSALDVRSFAMWAKLSGVVPRIAVVAGRCFAGNAVIAGCSDFIVATSNSNLGMAGPAMIAGGGMGRFEPEEIGPIDVQTRNGVVDVAVRDEAEAVAVARKLLGYFQGHAAPAAAAGQERLRSVVPQREQVAYDVRPVVTTLADEGSVTFLREKFAPELVTALIHLEGRAVGVIANQTLHMAGAITSNAADKAARFLQLCDSFGLPVVSLVDTPGMMVGPEAEKTALVRHTSRLLVAGARLQVPLIGVVLRRGYGLGAQAMLGGSTHEPVLTLAWPSAHLGPMGLEGAVRLGMRKQLEAIADDAERERAVRQLTEVYREKAKALNAARVFEIDDVIDPADTRRIIAATLDAAAAGGRLAGSRRPIDTW